ncbi:MAG: hypothetical protein ACTHMZ_01340 [Actinomycetes bacterium]
MPRWCQPLALAQPPAAPFAHHPGGHRWGDALDRAVDLLLAPRHDGHRV